jgi:hypothetical protein
MVLKRRPEKTDRRAKLKPKPKSRSALSSRRRPSPKTLDLQQRAFRAFANQADSLWSGLTNQCQQFAEGFNQAAGGPALQVHVESTTVRVAYPPGDAELFLQLDKDERYVQAWLNSGCTTYGSCLSDQLPVGLTVTGDELQFVLRGDIVSDEHVAVVLLTQLTSGTADQEPS